MMKIGWFLVVKVVSYGGFVLVRVERVVVRISYGGEGGG
jgi:hypothetical protein